MTASAPTAVPVRHAAAGPSDISHLVAPPGHFIDGEFRPSAYGHTIDLVEPCRGTTIGTVAAGTADDIDRAVAAKSAWAAIVPKERSETLHRVANRIEEHSSVLVTLESATTGKPLAVARDDVASAVDTFRFMAGAARAFTTQGAADYAETHLSVILREPLGVVGAITPWNYPLLMAAWKLAPILAAGNTTVLKPAEQTPLSTLKLAELTSDGLPPGVLNVVTGYGPETGGRLSEHPDIAMIALTGSVGSGRAVAAAAAGTVKRVHLELGGKAPVIVFADTDLDGVAESSRTAAFWNSGQECGAACRVLVHESAAERFVGRLLDQVRSIVVGEPGAGEEVEVGPLVSQAHFERVREHLERAAADGARAAIGGHVLEGPGWLVAPAVLVDVPEHAACAREEIFGPVVSVETFRTEEEAIARANQVGYGLAASVWTENARRSHAVAARLDFGTIWINAHLVLATEVPWGGFKDSGYGRDLSLYALDDYSRTKHVMHNHARPSGSTDD